MEGFDAFISYSHADRTSAITAALQHRLERFGRRWPRARALRVFRDRSNLSASPGLWGSIEEALLASRWFILVASPEAAASAWVRREVGLWLGDPERHARLLIVLTGGTLVWDEREQRFAESSTAAPPSLLHAFREEPFYLDLTGQGDAGQEYSQAGLEAAVASLAARIQGRSLDEVVGAHLREQRRNRRLAGTAISTLAVLTAASLTAAFVAVNQTREARRQADRALARQLGAQAVTNLDRHLDLAQLLAARAYRIEPGEPARAALLQAVTAQPALVGYVPIGETVTSLAGSADGTVTVAGTAAGHVVRWTTDRPQPERIMSLPHAVDRVAVDRGGARVIAADHTSTSLWTAGSGGRQLESSAEEKRRAIGLSPSGRFAAYTGAAGTLHLLDLSTNRTVTAPDTLGASVLVVPDDKQMVLAEYGYGGWQRLRLPDLARVDADQVGFGIYNSAAAVSPDGSLLTYTNGDVLVSLWPTRSPNRGLNDSDLEAGSHGPTPDALAVSPDNKVLATAVNGSIYLSSIVTRGRPTGGVTELGGNTTTQLVTFFGDADHLLSASGDAVARWDLRQAGRIGTRAPTPVPGSCNACSEPWTALTGDGELAAFTSMYGDKVTVDSRASGKQLFSLNTGSAYDERYGPPVFLPDGRTLLVTTVTGVEAYGPFGTGDPPRRLWSRSDTEASAVVAAALLPGQRLLVARTPNVLETRDTATGRLLSRTTMDPRFDDPVVNAAAAAVDPSGTVAAFIEEKGVAIVDPRTGATVATIAGEALRVHFGGDVLAVQFSDGHLEIRRPADGSLVLALPGTPDTGNGFAISADGRWLSRIDDDARVQLFDLTTGRTEPFGVFGTALRGILSHTVLAYTATGDRLVLALEGDGSDAFPGEIQQWRLSAADWLQTACRTANRTLTGAEWDTYVGDRPRPEGC